jgi:hypothetical protein
LLRLIKLFGLRRTLAGWLMLFMIRRWLRRRSGRHAHDTA